jgi:hypothetical protein
LLHGTLAVMRSARLTLAFYRRRAVEEGVRVSAALQLRHATQVESGHRSKVACGNICVSSLKSCAAAQFAEAGMATTSAHKWCLK